MVTVIRKVKVEYPQCPLQMNEDSSILTMPHPLPFKIKEGSPVVGISMNEARGPYVKREKPETEREAPNGPACMQNLEDSQALVEWWLPELERAGGDVEEMMQNVGKKPSKKCLFHSSGYS